MSFSASTPAAAEAAANLGWLVQAGVDTLVVAAPRRWLEEPRPEAASVAEPANQRASQLPKRPALSPLPVEIGRIATFAELVAAVAAFPHPLCRNDILPHLLTGNGDSGVIILCDQPEAEASPAADLRRRMLAAIGLKTDDYALLHRAPWPMTGGRAPRTDELAAFAPFVSRALALVRPRAILALGQLAAAIAGDSMALASARGRWHNMALGDRSVPLLATLHPRLLVLQPERKREVWADLQAFASRLATA